MPSSLVPDENVAFLNRDSCDVDYLCLPTEFVAFDSYVPASCRSTLDAEGRCLPSCLPDIAEQEDLLPQDQCPEHYLCAPCYDPFDGNTTELCDLGNDTGPAEPAVTFDKCCHEQGWCIPTELVPAEHQSRLGVDTCDGDGPMLCMPEEFRQDDFVLASCRSTQRAEGRCVPICLPEVADQMDGLPQDVCPAYYRCAPCYDPFDGESTGLCELGGDPGPLMEPVLFETCCDDLGSCVPLSLIPQNQQEHLGIDMCPENQGLLCVPDDFIETGFIPTTCHGVLGAEGRCVPECLPEMAKNKDLLYQDICPEKYLCAPCYDPFSGDLTGLCEMGEDTGPTEPAVTFDTCCNGGGSCIPAGLISENELDHLGPDTCEGDEALLCAPDDFFEEDFVLDMCRSTLGAEGRCVPICLPDVAGQQDDLPQDICPANYRCAPCYDPTDGISTGLCELGGDPGPTLEPVVFEACCNGLGSCVPEWLISGDQQSHLGLDACTANQGLLCVPHDFMEDGFVPTTCHGVLEAEGRCISTCLPEIAEEQDSLYQDICPAHHLCAPCYDPFTGDATGLCELGDDPGPTEPAVVFDACCGELGTCIPKDLIPQQDLESLGSDTCTGDETLRCVPDAFLEADFVLEMCRLPYGGEGRCAPICLPEIAAQQDDLPQDLCPPFYRCAPCYDPITGEDTGVCRMGGDPGPALEPVVFEACCDEAGTCVPQAMIPEDQHPHLGLDVCTSGYGLLCVPDDFLVDDFIPTTCHGILAAEGRCVAKCLPAAAGQAFLVQDVCEAGERCAPCYDPFSGDNTEICEMGSDPGPTEPAVIFDRCCEGLGRCVPDTLVSVDQQAQLSEHTCAQGQDLLCAPDFIVEETAPSHCYSIIDAEGRCLPECLPAIAEQAGWLPQDICPEYHLCAPCYDLYTGIATGACEFPGDSGPVRPPVVFETCCDSEGRCLPKALISAEQQTMLGDDVCSPDQGLLCVPDDFQDDGFIPTTCTSFADLEGRCLPDCLPWVATQGALLPETGCPENSRCSPCFDPFTGEATGACHLPGDPGPQHLPVVFDKCCEEEGVQIGTCVPSELIPAELGDQVVQDSCTQENHLCAPNSIILDPAVNGFPTCTAGGVAAGDPGACVPGCYLDTLEKLLFTRTTCNLGEHCVPCEFSGESTGVCT
ncbi:MAG: hypothetical protein QNJ97_05785 [Myxococcota bacterium]|nr:hypothetical protein [Myxococcota bacterium]